MSVQIGFVVGALTSTLLTLADRVQAQRLFAVERCRASLNGAIALFATSGSYRSWSSCSPRRDAGRRLSARHEADGQLDRSRSWAGDRMLVGALTVGWPCPIYWERLSFGGAAALPPWRSVLLGRIGACA